MATLYGCHLSLAAHQYFSTKSSLLFGHNILFFGVMIFLSWLSSLKWLLCTLRAQFKNFNSWLKSFTKWSTRLLNQDLRQCRKVVCCEQVWHQSHRSAVTVNGFAEFGRHINVVLDMVQHSGGCRGCPRLPSYDSNCSQFHAGFLLLEILVKSCVDVLPPLDEHLTLPSKRNSPLVHLLLDIPYMYSSSDWRHVYGVVVAISQWNEHD